MSRLADLKEKLAETQTLLAKLKKAMPSAADPTALALTLASLEERRAELEEEAAAESAAQAEASLPVAASARIG